MKSSLYLVVCSLHLPSRGIIEPHRCVHGVLSATCERAFLATWDWIPTVLRERLHIFAEPQLTRRKSRTKPPLPVVRHFHERKSRARCFGVVVIEYQLSHAAEAELENVS